MMRQKTSKTLLDSDSCFGDLIRKESAAAGRGENFIKLSLGMLKLTDQLANATHLKA